MEGYFCNTCNKKYASYQSLWNHNKKFHRDKELTNSNQLLTNSNQILTNRNQILTNNRQILTNSSQLLTNSNQITLNCKKINDVNNNIKYIEKSSISSLQCGYCNKIFKYRSDKSVHIKFCKLDHPEIQIINNKNICDICNKKFVFSSSVHKHRKICLKKQEQLNNNTSTINNINSNNTTNNNTTNNNTINNTINNTNSNNTINNKYIVNFSDNRDFFKLLSQEQKVHIIEQCRQSFTKMIPLTNFNEDYPELQNIYFINLKNDIGYVFEDSKFIAINKSEVLNEIYNNKIDLIYEILDDTTINNKFKENFRKFYTQLCDTNSKYKHKDKKYDNLKEYIFEQMNFIIYNNSNKKLFEKLKKSETLKKITVNEFFSNLENKRNNAINNRI